MKAWYIPTLFCPGVAAFRLWTSPVRYFNASLPGANHARCQHCDGSGSTADQTQNDNQPRCIGLFIIGSCNVSQTNVQTITTARTRQEAASTAEQPSATAAAYEGTGWTILIVIGALCWLFVLGQTILWWISNWRV